MQLFILDWAHFSLNTFVFPVILPQFHICHDTNNKHVYDLNFHLDFHLWFDTSPNFRLLLFAFLALTNHERWHYWNKNGMSILLIGKVKYRHSCTSVEEIINSFLLLQISFSDVKHESA
jgi:hypothetical protein